MMSSPSGSVVIRDHAVNCPKCGHHFEVTRQTGQGAWYVRDWEVLPKDNYIIISSWLGSPYATKKVSKVELIRYLKEKGVKISDDGFNGRISELLGLSLCAMIRGEAENMRQKTTNLYLLNVAYASTVLNQGGVL